ncbi:hypothetical protein [Paracoccus mutanolyticus]|uniref:hypothetical protein n=1 Tax=Paracoccus mutanolyticus TaxID=1499308 RepID=UPI001CB92697|nr:hypothetical protein [Paracoccus mutanolyticus]
MPLSGWFWQLAQDGTVVAKSPSLFDNVLETPQADFTGGPGTGPGGEPLRVTRHAFTLPGSQSALAVTITAPRAEIDASMARLRRPLAISLGVLGLALALASVAQVAAGLASLDRMGRDLRAVRAGKAESLPLPPVAELRPIAAEINGLLEQNRLVLARARDHVGNLAHSLKTPLAALDNALPPATSARRWSRARTARSAGSCAAPQLRRAPGAWPPHAGPVGRGRHPDGAGRPDPRIRPCGGNAGPRGPGLCRRTPGP